MRLNIWLFSLILLFPSLSNAKDKLYEGEYIYQGQSLLSPNGQYVLEWRPNIGYAVFRADGSIRYFIDQWGRVLVMQGDGNFVNYTYYDDNSPWEARWSSNTGGRCPCPSRSYLRIWDDGNLTIEYGQFPQSPEYIGRIWEIGKDSAPLTTTSGRQEYATPPGPRPINVPDPSMPASYDY